MATVEPALAGNPLSAGDLEAVTADSLAATPAAKKAWPLAASQEDITTKVANIEVPTLVISGELNRVDPPTVLEQELIPRVPQAKLHLLKSIGHLSPLEAPDEVARLIRAFVGGLQAPVAC